MPRGFKRGNNDTKNLLILIAKCLGAMALAGSTGSPIRSARATQGAIAEILKSLDAKKRRSLYELRKRNIIKMETDKNGETILELTHQGQQVIHKYNLEKMKLKKPASWDKRWRIISYDIPSKKRKASQALARKLHELGLFQFQRSFWISPYECMAELEFMCAIFELEIDRHIFYFSSDSIPQEKEVRDFFNL